MIFAAWSGCSWIFCVGQDGATSHARLCSFWFIIGSFQAWLASVKKYGDGWKWSCVSRVLLGTVDSTGEAGRAHACAWPILEMVRVCGCLSPLWGMFDQRQQRRQNLTCYTPMKITLGMHLSPMLHIVSAHCAIRGEAEFVAAAPLVSSCIVSGTIPLWYRERPEVCNDINTGIIIINTWNTVNIILFM